MFGRKGTGAAIYRRFAMGDTFAGASDEFLEVKALWPCRVYGDAGQMTRDPQGIWDQKTIRAIGDLTGLSPELKKDDRLRFQIKIGDDTVVRWVEIKEVEFPKRHGWLQDEAVYIQVSGEIIHVAEDEPEEEPS